MGEWVGRHYRTGEPVRIAWDGNRIASIEALARLPTGLGVDTYVAPGFVDIQINGFGGIDFCDPELTTERVVEVAHALWRTGTTHFLPTQITNSIPRMQAALRRLREAAESPVLAGSIVGVHLEGPYLSREDGPRGAHPLEHCRDPDWDEFQLLQEAAGGWVKLVTLAPERPGALDFIRKAVASGVRIALGHTAASRDQIHAAVDAGATMATHLGNAAHDQVQRHRNYIYDQLAEDRLYASLIVDGHHLPPDLVKIFVRAKQLPRVILVSDAVQYAGLPAGVYDAGYRKFEVRHDGFIGVVGEPRLAGSGLLMPRGIENLVAFASVSFGDAIAAATEHPARYLGLEDRVGRLRPGGEASLALLRWKPSARPGSQLEVLDTIVAGERRHP